MRAYIPIVLVCASGSVFAGSADFKSFNGFDGFYAGLGIHNLIRSSRLESADTGNGIVFFQAPTSGHSIGPNAEVGYRRHFSRFLSDVDLVFRYFPGISGAVRLNAIHAPRVSSYANFGLEFKPGYIINPWAAVFGIVGFEVANYKVRYLFNSTNTKFHGWQLGPSFGLGAGFSLPHRLVLQMSYLYAFYNTLNFNDTGNSAIAKLYPRMNIVSMSLSYRFK
jgi:opacity protein-like surface antigen